MRASARCTTHTAMAIADRARRRKQFHRARRPTNESTGETLRAAIFGCFVAFVCLRAQCTMHKAQGFFQADLIIFLI